MVDCSAEPDNPECTGDSDGNWWDSIVNLIPNLFEKVSQIFSAIGEIPGKIINGIKDFFSPVIEVIGNIFAFLVELPGKIIDGIADILKTLFIPDDGFFKGHFDDIYSTLNDKFNLEKFKSAFSSMMDTDVASLPKITIALMGHDFTLMDFGLLSYVLPTIHLFIRGSFYYYLIRYHIANVYKLIRGGELT